MKLMFKDTAHRDFFFTEIKHCPQDCYYLPLLYLIGLTATTRQHFPAIYQPGDGIQPEVFAEGWQTSTSFKILRLAFNLFNDCCSDTYEESQNADCYCVSEIFATPYAPYFIEAIRLRYPNYLPVEGAHDVH